MAKFRRNKLHTKERRTSPRVPASEVVPQGTARLTTGQEVELVNFNPNGAISIRCGVTLIPGSNVQMRLHIPGSPSMHLGGRVRRCRVMSIKHAKIQYEAAIILDENLPLPLFAKVRKIIANAPASASMSLQQISDDIAPLPKAVRN